MSAAQNFSKSRRKIEAINCLVKTLLMEANIFGVSWSNATFFSRFFVYANSLLLHTVHKAFGFEDLFAGLRSSLSHLNKSNVVPQLTKCSSSNSNYALSWLLERQSRVNELLISHLHQLPQQKGTLFTIACLNPSRKALVFKQKRNVRIFRG